mmetsp:Transcript_66834/g.110662  ORF Transcript_66834/g.110662 Transcript_66834/m.110662 type:complete len:925 (+) Transcript_66834:35-2809(+)
MYRYVDGRQTFYAPLACTAGSDDEEPIERVASGESGNGLITLHSNLRRPGPKNFLTEDQRLRLQSFVDRFDAVGGLEPALRLIAAEVHSFFAFQACKTLQRLAKRFGATSAGDHRTAKLVDRCVATMPGADGVSMSRALWALGKLHLRSEALLEAAAARLPAVLPECGPITIATIWNAYEVQQFAPATCLDLMAEEILRRINECDPPEIAIVLHAAAQLQFPARDNLFQELVPRVSKHEGAFSARHLAVCLHAAARVGLRDEVLCQTVVARFKRAVSDVDALALTSAVYACGLIAFFDQPFFEAVADFLLQGLSKNGGRHLESQQVANIVYSFGKLGFSPEKCLHAVVQHVTSDFWRFKSQELDNITYGFALLKFRNEAYLARLSQHLTEGGRIEKLDAQSIVSMAYSYGLLGYLHHPTCRALGDHAIPKLAVFRPEEFSILIYSLGLLNYRHHDLLKAIVEHVPRALPQFTTQNVSNLLHGLGLVTFDRDDDFVCLVASHLAGRLHECTAQDIANPLTALMRMCVFHDELPRAVSAYVTSSRSSLPLTEFTSQELANTVYAFDALQVFDQPLFKGVAAETSRRLESFIPQEVANIVWAFSKQSFGTRDWFEDVLARCAPHAETPQHLAKGQGVRTFWGAEDLEKPLAALWHVRDELPSYTRLERVFRERFLGRIAAFLRSIAPQQDRPAPPQYQKDFASWGLYQVGPLFTEELLNAGGVSRATPSSSAVEALLKHYIDSNDPNSLLSRYGDKMILSVLPAARWVSSHVAYRLALEGREPLLTGDLIVEPSHPDEDKSEANVRRFKAEVWRESVEVQAVVGSVYRPVLLSTFLGNWRHRHTELVALDELVDIALRAVVGGTWPWQSDFWSRLGGDVEIFVPHTPCLSCVGAFAQLHCWAPKLRIGVAYQDWREWRSKLREVTGR